jgi:hypothetical protein
MTPDELGIVAKLAEIGRAKLEREDGVRDYTLRDLVRRFVQELDAQRWTPEPTMVCSVTSITDAPSRRRWRRCSSCDRPTDRPRRGLCDRCRKAEDRAVGTDVGTAG